MRLFENDIINITKIYSVQKYEVYDETKTKDVYTYKTDTSAYELIFFVSGGSDTHFCGVDITDRPNSMRYIPKGKFEGKYTVKKPKKGYCIDVYFDTDSPMPQKAMGFMNQQALKNIFVKLYNIWTRKEADYYVRTMQLFYEIISNIKNELNAYIGSEADRRLKKSYEYMLQNFCSPDFDYDVLRSVSGYKYTYFLKMFRKKYKMTPVHCLTKMRLEYAAELLATQKYSVSQTASICGYDNVYYFSRCFKKMYAVSPKKYLISRPQS